MALMVISTLVCLLSFCVLATIAKEVPEKSNLETYIVHIEPPDGSITESEDLESWYRSFLPTTTESSNYESRLVYSYRHVMKGFAARLSPEEVKEMEKKKGFISARPREKLSLHTTHSPSFLGLQQNMGFWKDSNYGRGVIIGILDTGITPDHPSFSDEGIPPPPAKWKGKCELKPPSSCNNKIIGAQHFIEDDQNGTLADEDGHGTHTASTAAGNFVKGANVYGNANGTAAGVAPLAHLAIYKVCIHTSCSDSDILAAMDTAVEDGVDVISISIGGSSKPFYENSIPLGAYSAMEKGIFVSCSAGNEGPDYFFVGNDAPWILTVGASTMDRKIRASAMLGNNEKLEGESAFQPKDYASTMFPLVYPRSNESDSNAAYCDPDSLHDTDVKGKTVLCEIGGLLSAVEKGKYVKAAGGAAMIIINPSDQGYTIQVDAHVLPAAYLSYVDGVKIKAYMNSTKLPKAAIFFNGTAIGDRRAPAVASFSSRGPSVASLGILKPDIVGPGVSILAAWPFYVDNNPNTKSTFNFASGTSMSCPHLSGVAALLKSAHSDWSPAAIKSAIMTTADSVNLKKKPIADQLNLLPADVFAIGAGHVNPSRANNPGLIYDIEPKDYIPYLCGLNYTNREVGMLLQRRVNCSVESRIPDSQLNYPSFSIVLGATEQRYTRTVTNVGEADSVYTVKIVKPLGVSVNVEPDTLKFSELHQKLTYEVRFILLANAPNIPFSQGSLKWTSDKYSVRSPIVVIFDTSE